MKRIAVEADRRSYCVLRATYDIAAESNRRKSRVWNSHGHLTTLPMAIPDAEISVVPFFRCVLRLNDTSYGNCG